MAKATEGASEVLSSTFQSTLGAVERVTGTSVSAVSAALSAAQTRAEGSLRIVSESAAQLQAAVAQAESQLIQVFSFFLCLYG